MTDRGYVPALRFRVLARAYDPVVRATTRERTFKERLLEQARIEPGHEVLDLGCGTGTLALMAKQRVPTASVRGLDGDPEILRHARAKARAAGADVEFEEGLSYELPYEDASLDRVLSTLLFHHLHPVAKDATAAEIARVLRPGGELHVADWGRQPDPMMRAAFLLTVQLLDGLETTRDNAFGRLPEIFEAAGLQHAEETGRLRTPIGAVSLYRAVAAPA